MQVKIETILLFLTGIILTIVSRHYWFTGSDWISSLFAMAVLLSTLKNFQSLAVEFIGYVTYGGYYLNKTGDPLDRKSFDEHLVQSIVSIILAVTLYSL